MSRNSILPLVGNEDSHSEGTSVNDSRRSVQSVTRASIISMEMKSAHILKGAEGAGNGSQRNGHVATQSGSTRDSLYVTEALFSQGRSSDKTATCIDNGKASDKLEDDVMKMELYHAMSPIIRCMEVFGIWHSEVIDVKRRYSQKTKCRRIFNPFNYSFVVLILLWFNLLRFIPAFFVGSELDPSRLYFKVIYLAFLTQCALNQTVIFWTTSKPGRVADFFNHWEKTIQADPVTSVNVAWVRRRAIIFAVTGCIYVFLHFVNQTSSVFSPVQSIYNSSQIFVAPFEPNPVIHVVIIVVDVFDFAVWIFSIFLFILFAMTLKHQFEQFDKRFGDTIATATKQGTFPRNFEVLRRQHTDLCVAVQKANHGIFTYLNLITYGTMVPLACFLLYQLLFSGIDKDNISAYFMYIIWILSIFVNVCVVSWIAALMSSSCHDPVDKIYNCVLKDISNEELLQVNMFLARLNGDPVGFTIYDLVTLTKPFILTIGGLGITYYAVIAEFQ